MERVLDYDRSIAPQETSWSCGPAAAQIVLDAAGIQVSESELIREIGATTAGTDTTHWIVDRSLAQRIPAAAYQVVWLPQDPPTAQQFETLWDHLTRSISAGYGLVVNWCVHPANRPVGVRGTSPAYPDGWTYHYVTYLGFYEGTDVPGGRAVKVVDSAGFGGIQEFWISFYQAGTLIPPKSYTWASSAPPLLTVPGPGPSPDAVAVLADTMGNTLDHARYAALLPHVTDALVRSDCLSVNRIAMWLAQIGHESVGLKYMEEIADGSAYEGRTDLGNTAPGDGPRFKGHGPIQITGRHNHELLSRWAYEHGYVDTPSFFVDNPGLLASDQYGFLGAVWYWTVARPDINELSDTGDLDTVTYRINGGLNGIDDRRARYQRALAFGDRLLGLLSAPEPIAPVAPIAPPTPPPVVAPAPGANALLEILALLQDLAATVARIDITTSIGLAINRAMMGDPDALRQLTDVAEGRATAWPDPLTPRDLARLILDYAGVHGTPPPPPAFACSITGTDQCSGGGTGHCMFTASGRCIREEYGQLTGGGAFLDHIYGRQS